MPKAVLLIVPSGKEHNSPKDEVDRVSGKIFNGLTRLTSVHAYADGRVTYSKDDHNDAQQ